jgi:putative membrane protein
MVGLAVMNWAGIGGASSSGTGLLFVAGLLGASAMVLPGISGAYMLLILGQYEPILDALHALKGGEVSGTLAVVAPVGIGVVAGIVGVSNLIRWALVRHEDLTLGFLLGLLIGSVVGIFPFQRPIEVDSTLMEVYAPTVGQAAAAVGLAVVGFGLTALIDRMGGQSTT